MQRLATHSLWPKVAIVGLLMACCGPLHQGIRAALPEETKQQTDARLDWWRKAKFGMFIHWGVYAVPAGNWKGKDVPGVGEWIMHTAKIPVSDYEPLVKQFNPIKYDARQWVQIAKNAGMKYIVITSKHHDGFCLFDSKLTDYDMLSTPYARDVLKPLSEACQRQDIKLCFYHSILDWHHPDANMASWAKYREHLKGQLKELLTNYGDIGVMWFDGEWVQEWDQDQGRDLEAFLRGLQPKLIVNNRIGKRARTDGDFGTPEQEIPPTGIQGFDWETNMTMNDTWGFKKNDANWKSTTELIQKLADIASKGGNFLLNVGPTAEGQIPDPSIERLTQVGQWMATNGESIYGTTASPFRKLTWGCATQKPGKLFLHVFKWPQGELPVPGLKNNVTQAYLLADPQRAPLKITRKPDKLSVTVPAQAPDPNDSVVVLEIEGAPDVDSAAVVQQLADGTILLKAGDATIHGKLIQYEGEHLGSWTDVQDSVSWDVSVKKPGKFKVAVTYGVGNAVSGSQYVIAAGNQQIRGTAKGTGGGKNFSTEELGQLNLPAAGRLTVAVKAVSKPGSVVMNLKQVELRPSVE